MLSVRLNTNVRISNGDLSLFLWSGRHAVSCSTRWPWTCFVQAEIELTAVPQSLFSKLGFILKNRNRILEELTGEAPAHPPLPSSSAWAAAIGHWPRSHRTRLAFYQPALCSPCCAQARGGRPLPNPVQPLAVLQLFSFSSLSCCFRFGLTWTWNDFIRSLFLRLRPRSPTFLWDCFCSPKSNRMCNIDFFFPPFLPSL